MRKPGDGENLVRNSQQLHQPQLVQDNNDDAANNNNNNDNNTETTTATTLKGPMIRYAPHHSGQTLS